MFWPLMEDTISLSDRLKMAKFVMTSNRFTKGEQTSEFEREWSEWLGVNYSLFVSSGSTANTLLVEALKHQYRWNEKTNILVPTTTWTTGVSPIIQAGMNPIFADISLDNYGIDTEWVEKNIIDEGININGVFYPHLLGLSGEMDKLKDLLPSAVFFQDLCESHGVLNNWGDHRGTEAYSNGCTFSFYYGHHMTTIEGGMVSTNDYDLYNMMRMKRSHGLWREASKDWQQSHFWSNHHHSEFSFYTDGFNFRNTDLAAVLGRNQLKRLDWMIERRQENFDEFYKIMKKYKMRLPSENNRKTNSSFCFPFIFNYKHELDEFVRHCHDAGIEMRPIIAGNLLRHDAYRDYGKDMLNIYKNAETAHHLGLYIGNNHMIDKVHFKKLDEILGKMFK